MLGDLNDYYIRVVFGATSRVEDTDCDICTLDTSISVSSVPEAFLPEPSLPPNSAPTTPTHIFIPAVPSESTSAEELITDENDEGFSEPTGEEAQGMDHDNDVLHQEAERLLALMKRQRYGYTLNRPRNAEADSDEAS